MGSALVRLVLGLTSVQEGGGAGVLLWSTTARPADVVARIGAEDVEVLVGVGPGVVDREGHLVGEKIGGSRDRILHREKEADADRHRALRRLVHRLYPDRRNLTRHRAIAAVD